MMARAWEKNELYNLFNRIKKRDFKGYTGIAAKNSIYAFLTNLVSKGFSFIFMVILARILMPELFGLYSLALATILLFVGFSEAGIGQTFILFISKELAKNNQRKAKSYAFYLLKVKLLVISVVALVLIVLAKFIAQTYYGKPIFLALLAGALYIIFLGLASITNFFLQAINDFKTLFFKEIFFQILRIVILPLAILYVLKQTSSQETIIFISVLLLVLVWILTLFFLLYFVKKKVPFLKENSKKLSKKEQKKILFFIAQLAVLGFSGFFFAQIDMLFLGRFVFSEFIGYYSVASSLVSSIGPLIAFSGVLLPLFSRLKGKRLEEGFKKSMKITVLISALLFVITFSFAPIIINVLYGKEYSSAINLLRLLSPLIISMPVVAMYTSYFIAKGNPKIITKWLIVATIMNLVLNLVLVLWLTNYGQMEAVFGIGLATVFSRYFYLVVLTIKKKKLSKI